jgi:general secretion pathway protein A
MYEQFYGLRERPFDLVPNPRYLYLTRRQREALSNLRYGLTTPRGLTLLLGDAGTGKTTLVQAVLDGLKDVPVRCVLLSNPTLTRPEFFEYLASAFALGAEASASKTRFLFELRRRVQDQAAAGVLNALIIDEAQSLPHELLEEVRLLSNMETTTTKLLNVVLAGQPELADRLNEPSLRQLKQRISLRCELRPMDLGETASYIAGRIRIAGGRPERIFTQEAVGAIFAASRGIPRTVNVVCDNALIGGYAAAVSPITAGVIREVCEDFDLETGTTADPRVSHREAEPGRSGEHRRAVAEVPEAAMAEELSEAVDSQPTSPMFDVVNRKRRFSFF